MISKYILDSKIFSGLQLFARFAFFINDSFPGVTFNFLFFFLFLFFSFIVLKSPISDSLSECSVQELLKLDRQEPNSDSCSVMPFNSSSTDFVLWRLGFPATRSFSATFHGKGFWDGVAGYVKREAALESVRQLKEYHIQNAINFYNFVKKKFIKYTCWIHPF